MRLAAFHTALSGLLLVSVLAGCSQGLSSVSAPQGYAAQALKAKKAFKHGMGGQLDTSKPIRFDEAAAPGLEFQTAGASLPERVDLRAGFQPIYDQGNMQTCGGFALTKGVVEYMLKQQKRHQPLSALFSHYQGRKKTPAEYRTMVSTEVDNGAFLSTIVDGFDDLGAVPESAFPYPDPKATLAMDQTARNAIAAKNPGPALVKQAKSLRLDATWKPVTTLRGLRKSLSDGQPVAFGIALYDSVGTVGADGMLPVPDMAKENRLGGHFVVAVGYDNVKRHLIVRNSWGTAFGDKGYFYMPYDFFKAKDARNDGWGLVFDGWTAKAR